MSEEDRVREEVQRAYARAVTSGPAPSGCCGGDTPLTKGVVAQLAGYTATDLLDLPRDSVVNAFGCGNPLAFSEVSEGDVVLDLGSGAGIDLLIAGKRVGPSGRVIGVDMTDEMITRARENITASGMAHVEVRKGLIEELPVEASSVDWVISNCVINLSPQKDRVFAEIARVLKPGGRMSVSDIVAQDLPRWVLESVALYSSCIAGAISEADYLQGLRDAGLVDVEVRERLVYDATQLAAFAGSELASAPSCCGTSGIDPDLVKGIAESLAGKIWSAKFFASKPG